jgi:hypothetical protein
MPGKSPSARWVAAIAGLALLASAMGPAEAAPAPAPPAAKSAKKRPAPVTRGGGGGGGLLSLDWVLRAPLRP